MTEAEFADLTDRYLAGSLTADGRDALARHLRSDAEARATFERQVHLHVALSALLRKDDPEELDRRAGLILADAEDRGERTLARLTERLGLPSGASPLSFPRFRGRVVVAALAAIAALAVAGFMLRQGLQNRPTPSPHNRVRPWLSPKEIPGPR
jgi:anti-sigma factor RsiW